MADKFGREKSNTEWLAEQAAALRARSNPCAGATPLIAMAERFEGTVAEISGLRIALQGLVDALMENDENGLTEFAGPMQAARAALKP